MHLSAQRVLQQQARVITPLMRSNRSDSLQESNWDDSIEFVSRRLASVHTEHGPDSIGLYVSGQLLTEDYYIFNKLAKGLIGTNNIDSNSRLCMSSAVAAYKQSLGADAPPCCYEDLDHADLILIAGSNTVYAHPILYRRIEEARQKESSTQTDCGRSASHGHGTRGRPPSRHSTRTDVALFNGMLHLCLWEGWLDQAFIQTHTDGFAELKDLIRSYTPSVVAKICGIREQDLIRRLAGLLNLKQAYLCTAKGLISPPRARPRTAR